MYAGLVWGLMFVGWILVVDGCLYYDGFMWLFAIWVAVLLAIVFGVVFGLVCYMYLDVSFRCLS